MWNKVLMITRRLSGRVSVWTQAPKMESILNSVNRTYLLLRVTGNENSVSVSGASFQPWNIYICRTLLSASRRNNSESLSATGVSQIQTTV